MSAQVFQDCTTETPGWNPLDGLVGRAILEKDWSRGLYDNQTGNSFVNSFVGCSDIFEGLRGYTNSRHFTTTQAYEHQSHQFRLS
jgi:hypothetical protein